MEKVLSLDEIKNIVVSISEKYNVAQVSLFGSYARGNAGPGSDVDLLVDKGGIKGLFQFCGFHLDLEEQLKVHVDLITQDSVTEKFLTQIRREEILLYERRKEH